MGDKSPKATAKSNKQKATAKSARPAASSTEPKK